MNCALWLNKKKVLKACEIAENLDIASLRGYFLAGSLVKWLKEHGGEEYAQKLEKLSADDERLNEKLAEIFGGKPLPVKTFGSSGGETEQESRPEYPSSTPHGSFEFISYGSGSFSYTQFTSYGNLWELFRNFGSLFGSFKFGSFKGFSEWEWEWLFRLFSQNYGSFRYGSFGSFAGFSEWEWEWLFRLFSQNYGSFQYGSFGSFAGFSEWEWEWLFRLFSQGYGSFRYGSFGSFAGFSEWEWEWLFRLFPQNYGSFRYGSFGSSFEFLNGLFGSFPLAAALSKLSALDEYDRIMLETLIKCPLDRFGYGIHNI